LFIELLRQKNKISPSVFPLSKDENSRCYFLYGPNILISFCFRMKFREHFCRFSSSVLFRPVFLKANTGPPRAGGKKLSGRKALSGSAVRSGPSIEKQNSRPSWDPP